MSRFGWRWFNINNDTHQLRSLFEHCGTDLQNRPTTWGDDAPNVAECDAYGSSLACGCPGCAAAVKKHGEVPSLNCLCGFYAFAQCDEALTCCATPTYSDFCMVLGVVEAWGGLVEHTLGFRSEFLAVRAAWVRYPMSSPLRPDYSIPIYRAERESAYVDPRDAGLVAMRKDWDRLCASMDYWLSLDPESLLK